MGKSFGAVYSPKEEETAPNGYRLTFTHSMRLATFVSGIGDK